MQICRISLFQIFNLHSAPPIPKHCFILSNHQTPRQKGLRSLGGQKKKHKMKNDPCRKSLPPGVNRFVEKGPLKPEKNKRASEASDKKSHIMKNDPCRKSLPP